MKIKTLMPDRSARIIYAIDKMKNGELLMCDYTDKYNIPLRVARDDFVIINMYYVVKWKSIYPRVPGKTIYWIDGKRKTNLRLSVEIDAETALKLYQKSGDVEKEIKKSVDVLRLA